MLVTYDLWDTYTIYRRFGNRVFPNLSRNDHVQRIGSVQWIYDFHKPLQKQCVICTAHDGLLRLLS